jgi:CspA family cold shock protein
MPSRGTVREWDDDRGWGVIDSADTPGGCWFHFSEIVVPNGLGTVRPGDRVIFTHEALPQDGFNYRAVLVWPPDVRPGTPQGPRRLHAASTAYRSRLTIRWADGTVTEGIPEHKRGK